MKNRIISVLLMSLVFVSTLFVASSCKEDAYIEPPMSSDKTIVRVYGPRPAMRGAEIRFIGTHMDRVTAVVFPVAGEVTEFTKKEKTEIRVIVPEEAGYGKIILKTPSGEVETFNEISYIESINVTYVTTEKVKAGEEIEIKGQFLYLVNCVIFDGGAFVNLTEENKTFDPNDPLGIQTLKVIVPKAAGAGRLTLSTLTKNEAGTDIGGIPVEVASGDWELTVVDPTITDFSPKEIKALGTLTVTGTDLDLVRTLSFGGGAIAADSLVVVNEAGTSLTVQVPADAEDGPVIIIAYSGVEDSSTDNLTMILPTVTALSPSPFKFAIKREMVEQAVEGGEEDETEMVEKVTNTAILTATGTNLDLVTGITFLDGTPDDGGITIPITDTINVVSKSATKIEVIVPIDAWEGDITLSTDAAKSMTAPLTLAKPNVTAYSSATIDADKELTFTGTDFDLITAITFPEERVIEMIPTSKTSFKLTVPEKAVAGDVTITMINGEVVTCPALTINEIPYAFIPKPSIPNYTGEDTSEYKAGEYYVTEIFHGTKLTDVQLAGESVPYIVRQEELRILIPRTVGGDIELTLISGDKQIAYPIFVTPLEITAWEGIVDGKNSAWVAVPIPFAGFAGAKAGAQIRFYIRDNGAEPIVQPNYGDWVGMVAEIKPGATATFAQFTATQENLDIMMNPGWSGAAFQLMCADCVIYKITYINN